MSRLVRILSFVSIGLFVVMLSLFLIFVYPNRPIAKILMYHSVTDGTYHSGPDISIDLFKRQLDHLKQHGYEPVFLKTIIQRHNNHKTIPPRWVALTFDGGYDDFYTHVYPLLRKYNVKATVFPVVSSIESEGFVTWAQLKEMEESGLVEIGSHSFNHLPATCLSVADAKEEKELSKAFLDKRLKVAVVSYAYPYGAVNDQAEKLVKDAGYEGAVGITYRLGEFKLQDVFNLRRIYVGEYSGIPLMFRFMLSGYYVPTRGLILRIINIKAPRDVGDCRAWEVQ
jgi:peptidoglycan/xylan/chitin deacetylase (PgdA/CDA1 family)